MSNNKKTKLPFIIPDSFHDWDNVSVARAICYSQVQSIAQHLNSRDNYEPEFTKEEIARFQKFLFNDCLNPDEKMNITFDEFINKRKCKK